MSPKITIKMALEAALSQALWLTKFKEDPGISEASRVCLRRESAFVNSGMRQCEETCKDKVDSDIDWYYKILSREYNKLKNDRLASDIGLTTRARNRVWQAADWKVKAYRSLTITEEGPYPYPEKLSYTKETVLELPSSELAKVLYPIHEGGTSSAENRIARERNKENELILPTELSLFVSEVSRAPNDLRDLERSLKYYRQWAGPIFKQIQAKTPQAFEDFGSISIEEDCLEKIVLHQYVKMLLILEPLLNLKKYIKLQGK